MRATDLEYHRSRKGREVLVAKLVAGVSLFLQVQEPN